MRPQGGQHVFRTGAPLIVLRPAAGPRWDERSGFCKGCTRTVPGLDITPQTRTSSENAAWMPYPLLPSRLGLIIAREVTEQCLFNDGRQRLLGVDRVVLDPSDQIRG
jgi:hypothetical protein